MKRNVTSAAWRCPCGLVNPSEFRACTWCLDPRPEVVPFYADDTSNDVVAYQTGPWQPPGGSRCVLVGVRGLVLKGRFEPIPELWCAPSDRN